MKNKTGISNLALAIVLVIIGVILFFVAPKYLNQSKSAPRQPEKASSKEDPASGGYVESYHVGMGKAREAVQASRERYGPKN
ncbi:MAG: hypothetical protein JW774_11325 [Candidatus Aureabacteria bacterium]|nr:hypothetical protein [Candidatus Auribacterota bacterium]